MKVRCSHQQAAGILLLQTCLHAARVCGMLHDCKACCNVQQACREQGSRFWCRLHNCKLVCREHGSRLQQFEQRYIEPQLPQGEASMLQYAAVIAAFCLAPYK